MNYELAAQIAQNLNPSGSWNVEQAFENQPEKFYLIEKDSGLQLFISDSRQKAGMIHINMSVPRVDDNGVISKFGRCLTIWKDVGPGEEEIPSMNISESKSPAQIAKAIETRILSESLRIQEKAMKIAEGRRNAANAVESTLAALSEALGTKPTRSTDVMLDCNAFGIDSWQKTGYGEARVNGGGGSVEFKFSSVPVSKALKLAAFLKAEIFNGQA